MALSTDDPGMSRIDLTQEYVRAVETYGLSYADLKELVRNSLEYSFLPGPSLWDDNGGYARFGAGLPAMRRPEGAVRSLAPRFSRGSEKAAQQWELERRFKAFEASL